MLRAFKAEDPGGVGKDNVIPFSLAGMGSSLNLNGLAQSFGIGRSLTEFIDVDGKLVASLELPGAKDYLAFLNMLYAEGLLDADFPATNGQALQTKIGSGNLGAAYDSVWQTAGAQAVLKDIPGATLAYIPPFAAADGTRRISSNGGIKEFTLVPKSSKKAAEVVKFCNAFMDPMYYKTIILGEEGVHHEFRDGGYYPLFPAFNDLNKGRWFYPVNAASLYLPLFAARAHKEERMGNQYDEINAFAEFKYVPPERFAPILPEQIEYGQRLANYVTENVVKMVVDASELAKYDRFVAEWKSRGGDELTAAYNGWYATWNK
jgi:putative aldouronate transport system substrate-binding protein